ncbi:MAG: hypothetical protein JJE55_02995 [Flavobacteriaceae bacterium]|nr:hypothetical protein [Flavobacteriaceae bacterium]
MTPKDSKNEEPIISYKAVEITNGKIIVKGNDFIEVNRIAEATGKIYKIVFVPNPNLTFVF